MGYIPNETVEEVLVRADIVQIISEYVLLKKRGKDYFGICPFHQENTPSFSVAPDKQIFYCFGCHAGGDVFKFLMLKEGYSYPEAIRQIALRVGVTIPDDYNINNTREVQERQRAYKIITVAAKFFIASLASAGGKVAQKYLASRKISADIQEEFQIGYALDGWDSLIKFFTAKGCKVSELDQLGLVIKNQQRTSYYDRFRSRIMLPIHDASGRIVGFGGRTTDDSLPKYLNTPETNLFNKRNLLYGLHLARVAMRAEGYVVVVEGYLDVIAAHQHGIKNVVATLGTALTRDQVKLLQRYTDEIIIAYDADAAGQRAALRGLDLVQELGCRVKILQIPAGQDPDDYIHTNGVGGWNSLIRDAYDLIDYKLKVAFNEGIPVTAVEKIAVLQEMLTNLASIDNPIEREENIKRVATALNLSWEIVASELKRYQKRKKYPQRDKFVQKSNNTINKDDFINAFQQAEFLLLVIILADFQYFSIAKEQVQPEHLENNQLKAIYSLLLKSDDRQQNTPALLMPYLDDDGKVLLSRLLSQEIPGDKPADILRDCIKTILTQADHRDRQMILERIKQAEQAGDKNLIAELLQQLQQLHTNL